MTKLEIFKCDRCKKHIELSEGESPDTVFLNGDEYELCVDCFSSVWFAVTTDKREQLDKFMETLME